MDAPFDSMQQARVRITGAARPITQIVVVDDLTKAYAGSVPFVNESSAAKRPRALPAAIYLGAVTERGRVAPAHRKQSRHHIVVIHDITGHGDWVTNGVL